MLRLLASKNINHEKVFVFISSRNNYDVMANEFLENAG